MPLVPQVAMFVLHLGSATFLLTEPVISAMTTGAATHVVTSQAKHLLGMKMPYISGPLGFFYVSLSVKIAPAVLLMFSVWLNWQSQAMPGMAPGSKSSLLLITRSSIWACMGRDYRILLSSVSVDVSDSYLMWTVTILCM